MKLIPRVDYMDWLDSYPQPDLIKVLVGQRRIGKSTLLNMYAKKITEKNPNASVVELNFENPYDFRGESWQEIFDKIMEKTTSNSDNYVFLDEVQILPEFERLINGLRVQDGINIYVTGSNSKLLSSELATLLTGRQVSLEVQPFDFSEYLQTQNSSNIDKYESFRNFMYFGSIPAYLDIKNSSSDIAALKMASNILETIIEKDIFERYEVYTKADFYKIFDFVLDNIGSPLSSRNISGALATNKINIDPKTVTRYLDILESAFLIKKVNRFDVKGKEILKTFGKYYVNDPIFRQVRLGKTPLDDSGHLLENAVYQHLKRHYKDVKIGKVGDNEVDFVARTNEDYIEYFQVALTTENKETLLRELKPLKNIRDNNLKYLLTLDRDNNPVYDGIRKLNVVDWMLSRH
ncbi:MAG: ATP-binding protein [Candidatus Ancillula sp.]|jgi:predicted AAA+ superfamily ATPase|nr:ATP-binding protein [Candidatus Ancillula sp.]